MNKALLFLALLLPLSPLAAETFTPYTADTVPQDVPGLWGGLDFRKEPLDVEVVKEWSADGVTCRYVIFTVCTVREAPCRIAAFYTFPTGAKKAPAFVWAHGGGQRAERRRGEYFARQGYASIDINWGGREIVEGIKKNTDWGKVDPSQGPQFYPGALRPHVKLDLRPDEHTIDPVPSARNGNWFLLVHAARRAITFLEQQQEVDGGKIGITGYSMGGVITSFAAIDPRVKAAAPMVGGTGFLTEDFPGMPGTARAARFQNAELFARTNDSAAYWPHIHCPVLVLNATNDFHGIFELSYRCVDLLPHGNWHASYNLHFNHGLGAEQWLALTRWFDHHLKGSGSPLPSTPASTFSVKPGKTATITVTPAERDKLASVEILYSHDPNPRTRFWKTAADAVEKDGTWSATVPHRENLPLLVFAQCTYRNGEEQEAFEGRASTFSITSRLHSHYPEEIKRETLKAGAKHVPVFHDFTAEGLAGWGSRAMVGGGLTTYKPQDPLRAVPPAEAKLVCHFGPLGETLSFRVRVAKNDFLHNGKKKGVYVVGRAVKPGQDRLEIACADLAVQGGKEPMADWSDIATLTVTIIGREGGRHVDLTRQLAGKGLLKMTWE